MTFDRENVRRAIFVNFRLRQTWALQRTLKGCGDLFESDTDFIAQNVLQTTLARKIGFKVNAP